MRYGRAKIVSCALMFLLSSTSAMAAMYLGASDAPILIQQPAYDGMTFYAYRPYGIPSGWYTTYDGYPVFRGGNGVWLYGSADGRTIIPTSYVVGSVLPSVVGLVPWGGTVPTVAPVVAPVHTAVVATPQIVTTTPPTVSTTVPVYAPPAAQQTPAPIVSAVYVPGWTADYAFLAIGNWSKSVDRMGVLHKPNMPVAWKGRYPQVIYAWTGRMWYRISCREWADPIRTLRGKAHELTVMVAQSNAPRWNDADMGALAQYAALWGYRWMGQIVLPRF